MVLEFVRALGRRWYVVLVGLMLTAAMVFGAAKASPPDYQTRGLILLLPSTSAVGAGGNPFLLLSGLEQPAGILVAYFSGAPARAEVAKVAPTAEYQIGIDDSTRGPVIAVDITARSAQEAMTALDHFVKQIPVELARLQTAVNAPADAVITSMPLTVDSKPTVDRSGMVRMVIAALVLGLVATGLVGYAVDSLVLRRRARREGTPPRRRRAAGRRGTREAAPEAATDAAAGSGTEPGESSEPEPGAPAGEGAPTDSDRETPVDEPAPSAAEEEAADPQPVESGRQH
ncbi:hypothetical protein [Cumulibacter manganitolerans]|uniref:hypothetical protein n=1 Tax=Cumulibacter manganitolerans TaxID=1884992 RepID=UPI001294B5DB|nr:hypothetical protein [Cumulibacter manganitolerans]